MPGCSRYSTSLISIRRRSGVAGDRQDLVLRPPGHEHRALDPVEAVEWGAPGEDRLEHLVDDRALDRRLDQLDSIAGRHLVAAGHHVAQREPAGPGPGHHLVEGGQRGLGHPLAALEEAGDPLVLGDVVLAPSARRGDPDDAQGPAALGQLERQGAAHRVADEVGLADPELVERALEVVGGVGNARSRLLVGQLRPAVVAVQGGRDHLVFRDQRRDHGHPAAPGSGEAMDEDDRLALTGSVEGRRDLGHG